MATIAQLEKMIQTSQKRIEKYNANEERYMENFKKALEKANVTEECITIDDENKQYPRATCSADLDFKTQYRITDSIGRALENRNAARSETRHKNKLEEQLKQLKGEAEEKENKYNNSLESALTESLKEAKKEWLNRMIEWYGNHYETIKDMTPKAKAKINRAKTIKRTLEHFAHRSAYRMLDNIVKMNNEIVYDKANKYESKEEYIKAVVVELEENWAKGIKKLTEKAQVFELNEKELNVGYATITTKGIEVAIRDNKERVVYARVIWAAEYSELVQPHTRYIITERKEK